MPERRRAQRPEVATLLWGVAFMLCGVGIIFYPPLAAPTGESFFMIVVPMAFVGCFIGCLVCVIAGLAKKRWQVISSLAVLSLLWFGVRSLCGIADGLWMRKFEESRALRLRFLEFMDRQSGADQVVELPTDLRVLSDRKIAYLTKDQDGNRFYCYSVFTTGIDNSRGYCWSQSGKPPGELAFPQIVNSQSLGGGWFSFSST